MTSTIPDVITDTYIVIALATVVENLREILPFVKKQLAVRTLNPKVNRLPRSFYQAPTPFEDDPPLERTG